MKWNDLEPKEKMMASGGLGVCALGFLAGIVESFNAPTSLAAAAPYGVTMAMGFMLFHVSFSTAVERRLSARLKDLETDAGTESWQV